MQRYEIILRIPNLLLTKCLYNLDPASSDIMVFKGDMENIMTSPTMIINVDELEDGKSLDETLKAADAEPDMKSIPGVMIEGKDLDQKIEKAQDYLDKKGREIEHNTKELPLDLLQAQITAMATYSNILLIRVNNERGNRGLPTIAQF